MVSRDQIADFKTRRAPGLIHADVGVRPPPGITKSYCFSVSCIITGGRGLSNEARRELLLKKSKVM